MTRRDILSFFHEPFGDSFHYGPEKLSSAHLDWPTERFERSGRSHYTYDFVLQSILSAIEVIHMVYFPESYNTVTNIISICQDDSKRVFIKDMSYHIIPPTHSPNARFPSLERHSLANLIPNPTVLPTKVIETFKFIFLIRDPVSAVPSMYRCFIPPLSDQTDETPQSLNAEEFGYREIRILFDHLRAKDSSTMPILIDAEDLLANPEGIIRPLCSHLGIPFSSSMFSWATPEDHDFAFSLFEKYAGYHDDALNSRGMVPRGKEVQDAVPLSREEQDDGWRTKYGEEGMRLIRSTVDACRDDYDYLKSFRMQPQ
ncbi:MAG: hypothetical protein Q9169_004461 [Polycauliona sp. 2 TL-2023]